VFQAASVTQAESALPTASGIMEAFGQSEGLSLPATTTEAGEQAAPLAQTGRRSSPQHWGRRIWGLHLF